MVSSIQFSCGASLGRIYSSSCWYTVQLTGIFINPLVGEIFPYVAASLLAIVNFLLNATKIANLITSTRRRELVLTVNTTIIVQSYKISTTATFVTHYRYLSNVYKQRILASCLLCLSFIPFFHHYSSRYHTLILWNCTLIKLCVQYLNSAMHIW